MPLKNETQLKPAILFYELQSFKAMHVLKMKIIHQWEAK